GFQCTFKAVSARGCSKHLLMNEFVHGSVSSSIRFMDQYHHPITAASSSILDRKKALSEGELAAAQIYLD
ncbi:hypothetical protein, partial [Klebsiella pneumoniae]|uniref:hypothetical protein n=1 Tax=Klebsiella pneumoniae TaxID=573 RepID=UPI00405585CB